MHRLLTEKKLYEKCPNLRSLELEDFRNLDYEFEGYQVRQYTGEMIRDFIPASVERLGISSIDLRDNHLVCLPDKISELKVVQGQFQNTFIASLPRTLKKFSHIGLIVAKYIATLPPALEYLSLDALAVGVDLSHLKKLHKLELKELYSTFAFSDSLKKITIHCEVSSDIETWLKISFNVKSQNGKTLAERI